MSSAIDETSEIRERQCDTSALPYSDIAPEELPTLLLEKLPVILDMRDSVAFEGGHIFGAVPADEQQIRQILTKRSRAVLVYCYHGHSSRDLAEFLSRMGVSEVYNLEGGWHALQGIAGKTITTAVEVGTRH